MNRLWALRVLCTGTQCKRGGGVNRLWALLVLCTGTLCKRGGGLSRLWARQSLDTRLFQASPDPPIPDRVLTTYIPLA